jgi:zinc transport system substrate-binding protein
MTRFLPLILVAAVTIGAGCTNELSSSAPTSSDDTRTSVVTSFYPLDFLAESIAGDAATVSTITPTGVDAHDFEPSPRDIAQVTDADVFLFQGAGVDPWAEDIEIDGTVIEMIDTVEAREGEEHEHEGEEHEGEEHEHDHGDIDPHTWLDPVLMQAHATAVSDALRTEDADNAETYTNNAQQVIDELVRLDEDFANGLATCEQNTIVVSHDAFGYLADRYGFETRSIAGLSPSDDPSAKELAELTELVEEEGITYIFTETLVSARLAETVANETGAQILTLNPLEGLTQEQIDNGENYFSVMRQNLDALKTGLACN